jgi:protein-L-isoaspartate(D-aspartate) O-methyltransferase
LRWLILSMLTLTGCGQARGPARVADFKAERERMVREQLVRRGIHDPRVLATMRKVPREEFVPPSYRHEAYEDRPLPLGEEETISQPYIVALMTELLRPQPGDRVFEVGTGSGYQAAILAKLVAEVYTMEIHASLAKRAEERLERQRYQNIHVKAGDAYQGWPEYAPFDGIIVTCALDHVPGPLIAQLKERGRMVIPVGEPKAQELYLFEKENGELKRQAVLPVVFVPMKREVDQR